jgi:hypothetical protein
MCQVDQAAIAVATLCDEMRLTVLVDRCQQLRIVHETFLRPE